MNRCFAWIATALALWGTPTHAADVIFPTDLRIVLANSLLDDKNEWHTAIALYEEVLAEDPNHTAARHWLARLLSWKGDYDLAFRHYDALLASPDPPPDARIERAEVLAWAGEYDEAETEFEAILAGEQANERAARGLVLVYHWSGRAGDSDEAYERALAISGGAPSEEMRKLKAELRSNLGTQAQSDSYYYADSDGFRRVRVQVAGDYDIDRQTRLLASTAYTGVHRDTSDPSQLEDDHAIDFFAGMEREFINRLRVNASIGFRHWSHAADRVLFRGEAEYTASERLVVGVEMLYDDFLEQSDSFEAVMGGLTITTARSWIWHEFNEAVSGYGYFDIGYVSDTNKRITLGVSYDYEPFSQWDVSFRWHSGFLTYSERSNLYYDPVVDFNSGISTIGRMEFSHGFSLEGKVNLGVSYSREGGIGGVGVAFGIEGGPTWTQGNGYFFSLRGRFSRSQRSTAYDSGGAWLSFGRDL